MRHITIFYFTLQVQILADWYLIHRPLTKHTGSAVYATPAVLCIVVWRYSLAELRPNSEQV